MLFQFLFRNLKGYRFLVFIAILLTFAQVASNIAVALPLKYIPDKLQNPQSAQANPPAFLDGVVSFFDRFDTPQNLQELQKHLTTEKHTVLGVILFSAVILVIFTLLGALLAYVQLYVAAFLAQTLSARVRTKLFAHLQRLSLDWHGKQKKGDLVQRVTGNITDIEKFVTDGLIDLLSGLLTIIGVATVMFYTNVPFTLLSLVIVPALAVAVFGYTRTIKAAAKRTSKAVGEVADVAVEDVGAITVLKAFSLEEREASRFNKYVKKSSDAGLRAGSLQAQFTPLVAILVGLGTAIIIGVGAYVAADKQNTFSLLFITISGGSIGIGTVVFFITLLGQLFQPMKNLSKLTTVASSATAGAERIQEVLDQAPEVADNKTPYTGPSRLRGEITFKDVLFGYTPEKLILKGINLHIAAGKKVALVGLSGGGKTTLVKLIPRFYEVTQGSLSIDGFDNRFYPLAILRQNVSMVLQESVLFEGTVLENLKIGRPDASMQEVVEAAQQAQIHETIMDWADGYGTLVRNQGKNFSGGQRQRMAIARAILSKAPILVLDEPTASLDVEAEAEVMRALDKLVVGRTVLMISHRLSTLGKVDEIIVLKDGRIVEQGSYQDLKRRGGVFATLLKEQNRYNVDYVGESIVAPKSALNPGLRQGPPSPVGYQNWSAPAGNSPSMPPGGAYPQNGRQQRQAHMPNGPLPAHILVEVNGQVVSDQQLNKTILTIGRLSTNDIQVLADRVSRLHARIHWVNGTWLIEDAESLNGIIYQGNRVDRHVLMNGDRIALGPKAVLHYKAG